MANSFPDSNCPLHIAFVGDVIVKPGLMFGPRTIPEYELVYFPGGSQTKYFVNQDTFSISSPGYIITRPGEEHGYEFDATKPTRHLFVHFILNSDLHHKELPFLSTAGWMPDDAVFVPSLLKTVMHMAYFAPPRWRERCNQMLRVILDELNALHLNVSHKDQSHQNFPSQIVSAMQIVEAEIRGPITVSYLADRVGWTHAYFCRVMKKHVGVSPSLYIMNQRIKRACNMLIYDRRSIKEIAYETGFADEHYFSRCFRRVKGISASTFRSKYSDPRAHDLATYETTEWDYPLNRWFHFTDSP